MCANLRFRSNGSVSYPNTVTQHSSKTYSVDIAPLQKTMLKLLKAHTCLKPLLLVYIDYYMLLEPDIVFIHEFLIP